MDFHVEEARARFPRRHVKDGFSASSSEPEPSDSLTGRRSPRDARCPCPAIPCMTVSHSQRDDKIPSIHRNAHANWNRRNISDAELANLIRFLSELGEPGQRTSRMFRWHGDGGSSPTCPRTPVMSAARIWRTTNACSGRATTPTSRAICRWPRLQPDRDPPRSCTARERQARREKRSLALNSGKTESPSGSTVSRKRHRASRRLICRRGITTSISGST